VVQRRIGHFRNLQTLGQETDASVDFAQALFAIEVIAVL